jgi:hypothetical protein
MTALVLGYGPSPQIFAKRMLGEAKRLDPNRLCSYASHSFRETPERDVANGMDFTVTNARGDTRTLDKHFHTLHRTFPESQS